MIRINLLPFRAARKRENIRRQATVYGLVIVLTIVIIASRFMSLINTVSALKDQEAAKKTELESYKPELEELKKIEAMAKEVKTKLDVITELEKAKSGPVLLLSAIADAVPRDKLWLTSMTESNGALTMTGVAMDNETVALFIDNLEGATDMIIKGSVDLTGLTMKEYPQYKLKVSDFALSCKTTASKDAKKTEAKPEAKK